MEFTRRVRELVSALPGIIFGLFITVYPNFAFPLLILSGVCFVGAALLDQVLENKELRRQLAALQNRQPSMRWGDLKVNPVSSKTFGLDAKSFTRYVTTITVINDGSLRLTEVTARAEVEGDSILLPWTVSNADGPRHMKNLNPKDKAAFEVCGWDTLRGVRVLPTESGWGQVVTEGQLPTQVKVTSQEGATLERNAKILRIQDLGGINKNPLLSWD